MPRRSKTQMLIERNLGQHLSLAVAAHLARTQLVPDAASAYDSQHLSDMLNMTARALTKVAPVFARTRPEDKPQEVPQLELAGATVTNSGAVLRLKDGRNLYRATIRRGDLRQAIAVLKIVGIPDLVGAALIPEPTIKAPVRPTVDELLNKLVQLEALLRPPVLSVQLNEVNRLAVAIARSAPHGRVANMAMRLVSSLVEAREQGEHAPAAMPGGFRSHLARLRVELEQAAQKSR